MFGLRFLVVCFVGLLALPANAQRVFRASSIDIEQNDRLDSLEAQVSRIEASVSTLVATLQRPRPRETVKESLTVDPEPETPKVRTVSVVRESLTPAAATGLYSRSELEAIVRAAYPNGDYTRFADVSPRSGVWRHLRDSNHRFTAAQVEGMPMNLALGLHGLHHVGRITPQKSGAKPPPAIADVQMVSTPARTTTSRSVQQLGGCANGSCARPSRSMPTQRVRLFGGLFRR